MLLELKNYPNILNMIKSNEKISLILEGLDFFRLEDDKDNMYFRDPRYTYLEDSATVISLKEDDLIEMVYIDDIAGYGNVCGFSNTVEVRDDSGMTIDYIIAKNDTFDFYDHLGSKLDDILQNVDKFSLEFKYVDTNNFNATHDIVTFFIYRSNPEKSSILF